MLVGSLLASASERRLLVLADVWDRNDGERVGWRCQFDATFRDTQLHSSRTERTVMSRDFISSFLLYHRTNEFVPVYTRLRSAFLRHCATTSLTACTSRFNASRRLSVALPFELVGGDLRLSIPYSRLLVFCFLHRLLRGCIYGCSRRYVSDCPVSSPAGRLGFARDLLRRSGP